jgi:hypothetical protein
MESKPVWLIYLMAIVGVSYLYLLIALRWVKGCWVVQAFTCKETWKKTLKEPTVHIMLLVLLAMLIYEILD